MRKIIFCVLMGAAHLALADAEHVRPGKMPDGRYVAMGPVKALDDMNAADRLYRQRKYVEAQAAYATWTALNGQSSEAKIRDVAPYAFFMEGMCLLNTRDYPGARARFAEVGKIAPKGDEMLLAAYYTAVALKEEGVETKAAEAFAALIANPQSRAYGELALKSHLWLKDYYGARKARGKEMEVKWAEHLEAIVAAQPDRDEYGELMEYCVAQRDWPRCRRVAALRWPPAEAEIAALSAALKACIEDYQKVKHDPSAAAGFAAKMPAFIKQAQDQLAVVKEKGPTKYKDIYLRMVNCLVVVNCPGEAGAMFQAWMGDNPEDRVALFAYGGYVRHGALDEPTFDATFLGYLKTHQKDAALRDVYCRVIRERSADKSKVLRVLENYGGTNWEFAEYWRGLDDKKAARLYGLVEMDDQETPARRKEAAWLAAESYRNSRMFSEAVPYYRKSDRGEAAIWNIGDCLMQLGDWKQAAREWSAAREIRGRELRQRACFEAAKTLVEHDDDQGAEALAWVLRYGDEVHREKARALAQQHKIEINRR